MPMKFQVKGRNIGITEALRSHAEDKLLKLGKNLNSASSMELELLVEKNPSIADNQVAEATIFTKGPVLRARGASSDMYASIDQVSDKLGRQVKKYRSKLVSHNAHVRHSLAPENAIAVEYGDEEEEEVGPQIVKMKQFLIKPMSVEEAALQLELIGHEFFVFQNADSNDTNVIYRRRDGDYGLIEPK
jgi:putative sigma-54 modulation protein